MIQLSEALDGMIGELWEDEGPPSPSARDAYLGLLAGALGGVDLPDRPVVPHLSTLGMGDLICEWRRGDRSLVLSIAPGGDCTLHGFSGPERVSPPRRLTVSDAGELAESIRWAFADGPEDSEGSDRP
jgi:hypothetical protein